jgi:hypothetical protein
MELQKQMIPLGVAAMVGYALCSLTYNAGSKVQSADSNVAFLTARVDGVEKVVKESTDDRKLDHDSLIKLQADDDSMKQLIARIDARTTAVK